MAEQILQLASGRRVGVFETGKSNGSGVFYMRGFPSSRLEAKLIEDQAAEAGVRLIALDRPGIGKSSPVHRFGIMQWPAAVDEVADTMAIRRYSVLGFSAGAAFALACAAATPDQVAGCVLISPVAPAAVLATASTGITRLAWQILQITPDALLRPLLSFSLRGIVHARPDQLADMLAHNAERLGVGDRAVLQDEAVRRAFAAAVAEGYVQGPRTNQDQAIALARPWGFDLDQIDLPVRIYHGAHDQIMPAKAARALAAGLRHGTLFMQPEGHISTLVRCAAPALESLRAALR
ncbi:alpha/beta hydrolase [Mesorhizobium sp. B2-6-2]|uniref:alpha/beta fold hydrolase n=1 Tax=Mesorhizobium sp. B2-6-2 TaxID=2589915 RepID=UPI00112EE968|nr:alpha/beta hydrolase [Mesorhizobium sp. B2-6-2]TPJ82293.1 alpha/beta hydrolase [Mesorhizobium sp. B2-6-2]